MVATVACWTKVSSVSSYINDVWFAPTKGQVRVGAARFIGSIWILVVGVPIRRSSWLDFGAATSNSSFVLFSDKIWFLQPFGFSFLRGSNPLDWWWRIASMCCLGCLSSWCSFNGYQIPLFAVSGYSAFKILYVGSVAGVPFPYCFFSKFHALVGG